MPAPAPLTVDAIGLGRGSLTCVIPISRQVEHRALLDGQQPMLPSFIELLDFVRTLAPGIKIKSAEKPNAPYINDEDCIEQYEEKRETNDDCNEAGTGMVITHQAIRRVL